jgi:hypothetical protein
VLVALTLSTVLGIGILVATNRRQPRPPVA